MKRIRSPFSLSINDETGCLVDGFDTPPMVMMPHHRPYQGKLIEEAGFQPDPVVLDSATGRSVAPGEERDPFWFQILARK